tara:strand:+ start:3145 stop:3462 length:318 start_codon:yes stop_codon:yes gene_type:complete
MNEKYGAWAFTAGIVLAVILGFVSTDLTWLLIILGLVVGFVNVTEKESTAFLIASMALVITAGALTQLPALGGYVTSILANVVALVSPAAIVVGLKAVWELGGKK